MKRDSRLVDRNSKVAFLYCILDKFYNSIIFEKYLVCTIVDGGSGIMAKKFGVFCTKICYFIEENMTKNGPLVFRTVLCSKYDEKMGNYQRKTMR